MVENTRPTCARKKVCVYGVDLRSKYKPGLSRVYTSYAVVRIPFCVNAFTQIRTRNEVYTPAYVAAHIYAELSSSGLRTISERWIYFISCIKACVVRRGRGLLANDNPASTYPGQQNYKRRAKVSVNLGVLCERLYLPSARSLRRRSVLVTERVRPTHAKWYADDGVDLRSKYKPG